MPAARKTTPAAAPNDVRPQVRERKRKGGQIADRYELPEDMLADFTARGMSVEWKRETLIGANDPSYDVFLREQGWEPVDGDRFPGFVMAGHQGPIRRDGMILMERPVELTQEAMAEDRDNARRAVAIKEQQLQGTAAGEFQRHRADGSSTVQLNKSMERGMPIE